MVNEKYDDKKILKDIFLGSLELVDPAKKIEKMKFDSPLGRLFFVAVGKGAGRLAKAFYKAYKGKFLQALPLLTRIIQFPIIFIEFYISNL